MLTGPRVEREEVGVGALLRQHVPPGQVGAGRPGVAVEGRRAVVEPVAAARVRQVGLLAAEHARVVGQQACWTVIAVGDQLVECLERMVPELV